MKNVHRDSCGKGSAGSRERTAKRTAERSAREPGLCREADRRAAGAQRDGESHEQTGAHENALGVMRP